MRLVVAQDRKTSHRDALSSPQAVRDYDLHSRLSDLRFLHAAVLALLDAAGLNTLAEHLEQWSSATAVQRFNLDGLLALWPPADAN